LLKLKEKQKKRIAKELLQIILLALPQQKEYLMYWRNNIGTFVLLQGKSDDTVIICPVLTA